MNIRKLRNLRHVRRFNFHNCNKYESVAEHSFFVALTVLDIIEDLNKVYPIFFGKESVWKHVRAALLHDVDEAVFGDIPFLVRRRFMTREIESAAWSELGVKTDWNADIQMIVDFADAIELKMYLEEERRSGNTGLYRIECETMKRLRDAKIPDAIRDKWLARVDVVPAEPITEALLHE